MKKIIVALGIVFLFIPAFANAQVDSKCFTKEQCVKARADFGSSHPNEGFYEKPDCGKVPAGSVNGTVGESMGYCLPASETVTQIRFGGKQNFENIGDFLKYIYKYGVMVAGILATVMIIVAGFQWVASGGNSATIGEAKKRIFGAIIGLVLAVGSYTILETVNPALVEFRLPQVWMINKVGLGAQYCNLVKEPVALAVSKDEKAEFLKIQKLSYGANTPNTQTVLDKQLTEEEQKLSQIKIVNLSNIKTTGYNVIPKETECGSEYFMQNSGSLTCQGATCKDKDKTCVPFDTIRGEITSAGGIHYPFIQIAQSACWKGNLVINYKVSSDIIEKVKQATGDLIKLDFATLEQTTDDDRWLEDPFVGDADDENNMSVDVYPVCFGNSSHWVGTPIAYQLKDGKYSSEPPKYETIETGERFYDYILQFSNFDKNWECPSDKPDLVGFIIKNEININLSVRDAYVFITKDNNITGSGHLWCDEGWLENYIPIEDVTNGNTLYLEVTLNQDLIDRADDEASAGERKDGGDECE